MIDVDTDSAALDARRGSPPSPSMAIVAVLAVAFHPLVLLYAVSGSAMMSARLRIPKP